MGDISVVGRARASSSVLMDSTMLDQPPEARLSVARWFNLPSRPTSWQSLSSSRTICCLNSRASLKASAGIL